MSVCDCMFMYGMFLCLYIVQRTVAGVLSEIGDYYDQNLIPWARVFRVDGL